MAFEYRRRPAVRRRLVEIKEDDVRVRIIGTIVSKDSKKITIDDGTATKEIVIDSDYIEEANAELRDKIEVIARVMPTENGFEIKAEIITDMNNMDADLYKKVFL